MSTKPLRGGLPQRDPDREAAGVAFGADDGSELITGARAQSTGGTPGRGSDGKFTKGEGKESGAGDADKGKSADKGKGEAAKAAAPAGNKETTPRKSKHGPPQILPDGKIRMAGKVFNDLAHLQQVFLSKAGDASTASSRMATLEQQNTDLRQRVVDAVSVANQWQKYAEGGGGAVGQQEQTQGQQQAAAAAAKDEGVKRNFTLAAYNAMREKFGDAAANEYAQKAMAKDDEEASKRYTDMLDAKIQERLGPLEQQTQTQAEITAARTFLQRAMPQFAELRDPAAREAIVRDWISQPVDLRYSEDLRGIRYAVLNHRDSQSAQRAESDDIDPLGDLDLPAYTLDDASGADSGVPRPGDGAAGRDRDLEASLVHPNGEPSMDEDTSFLPSP